VNEINEIFTRRTKYGNNMWWQNVDPRECIRELMKHMPEKQAREEYNRQRDNYEGKI